MSEHESEAKTLIELLKEFPLYPIRNKAELEVAVKVMKRLAYRRSSLSIIEADYLAILGHLIAEYEETLPKLEGSND